MQNQMAKMISEQDDWSKIEYQYYFSSIIVKICKAVEARRNSVFPNYSGYELDTTDFKDAFSNNIEGTYHDQLADAYIMVLSFCGNLDIDVEDRSGNIAENVSDREVYYLFNKITSIISQISGHEVLIEAYKGFIQSLIIDCLIYIESLAERAGKDIHWHVGNKLAYNSLIENESNNNG